MIQLGAQTTFTKSSYSGGNGACVEVRSPEATAVQVIDSKHGADASPVLSLSPAAFTALVDHVRA